MRQSGSIDEVRFTLKGFSITYLAYEYQLILNDKSATVYVDNYKQLKDAIAAFIREQYI